LGRDLADSRRGAGYDDGLAANGGLLLLPRTIASSGALEESLQTELQTNRAA
jgi:hypothetical protein